MGILLMWKIDTEAAWKLYQGKWRIGTMEILLI